MDSGKGLGWLHASRESLMECQTINRFWIVPLMPCYKRRENENTLLMIAVGKVVVEERDLSDRWPIEQPSTRSNLRIKCRDLHRWGAEESKLSSAKATIECCCLIIEQWKEPIGCSGGGRIRIWWSASPRTDRSSINSSLARGRNIKTERRSKSRLWYHVLRLREEKRKNKNKKDDRLYWS